MQLKEAESGSYPKKVYIRDNEYNFTIEGVIMSSIHYFPRYSQKENMVTNNTLLLFSRLYNHSNDQFNRFINTLFEGTNIEQLDTTIQFHQQVRSKRSVPDAVIEQQSFKIIIETKLYGHENIEQIRKHCDSFDNEDKQIFLWIDKESISIEYYKEIKRVISEINDQEGKQIVFVPTTFKDICRAFNEVLSQFDWEMIVLIEDYEAFCYESGLIDNADTKMRVVLAGTTFQQNLQYNIYYAPSDRGYQNHLYLGLYKEKAVRSVGKLISSADIRYDPKSDRIEIIETQLGKVTESQLADIKKVIREAKDDFGYDLTEGHRFFFVEKFYETEYLKPTKGALMGQKYFDLADIKGYSTDMDAEKVANLIREKEWQY